MNRPECLPPFKHIGTDAIHAGQPHDSYSGAVIGAISLSTTFSQQSPGVPTNVRIKGL